MSLKASLIVPYYERKNAQEHLVNRVLPALKFQGRFSCDGSEGFIYPWLSVLNMYGEKKWKFNSVRRRNGVELIIVHDNAVRPNTRNCCLQINVGLKRAEGEVFVLLHQDVVPQPNAIEKMIEHVLLMPDDMLYATVYKEQKPNDPAPRYHVGIREQNEAWFLIACNRQKLVDLGGVDEDFWAAWGFEDLLMSYYWKKHFNVRYVDWAGALHLWHEQTSGDFEINRQLYFEKATDPNYQPNANNPDWGQIYEGGKQ